MAKIRLDIEKKLYFTVGFFSIAIILVGAMIVWPTISQIYKINKDSENLKTYLERKHSSVMGLKTAKTKVSEIKETVASFSNYFYYNSEELKLITLLEEIAQKNTVTQKINGYEIKDNKALLSINLSGDYKDLLNYLVDLEHINLFINTDALHFSKNNNRSEYEYNMRIELSLYVYN